jgi:pimeloyl-ACP methyl ester carboxylesterase
MIAPLFHRWERYLAGISKDRVVRPFEWGLDWLPHDRNGHDPERTLLAWVKECLADSRAFFDTPPTSEYTLTTDPVRLKADPTDRGGVPTPEDSAFSRNGGLLSFPSAFTTPHPENNTVWARYFPARRGRPRSRAVVVLPQWNSDPGSHVGLCRGLAHFGISALRLSLPYHDRRMPPELHRADYIVSSNVARTVQVCRQAVMDTRRAVAWLDRQGYERIGLLGTSLGSCLSMLTAAHEPRVSAQALNHISPYFADVVWEGLSTAHVRTGLDTHITLDRLRALWLPISPQSYLDRIRDKKTLLIYARYDLSFPVGLSRALVDEFARRGIPHQVAVLPCGHYSTGIAPFKYLDGYVLVNFLVRNL